MKILFVVNHPVDPYIVLHLARSIEKDGGEVLFAVIEKEGIIKAILDSYNLPNILIGRTKKTLFSKILLSVIVVSRLIRIVRDFNPRIVFSPTSPYTSFALFFSNKPLICWADTESATRNIKLSIWRANAILIPESFYKNINSKKVVRFNSYKELAYLHPNVFTPDDNILQGLGLTKEDKIILLRFSALRAMHDVGLKSVAEINPEKLLDFIETVEGKFNAKVLISVTERDLDSRFEKYKLRILPEKYVHLLAYCNIYIGEGTTTASEAGVLGVPWIALRKIALGYLNDQEKNYDLGKRMENLDYALSQAIDWLENPEIMSEWKVKRQKLLKDKIDLSSFLIWFVNNYPESLTIMQEDPDFQNRFLK